VTGAAARVDGRRYAAAALGTFALVSLGAGAAMAAATTAAFGHAGVALALGLAVTLIGASTGHLGAHVSSRPMLWRRQA
jgi:glycerol uptake facilitator-like aquaporin